MQLRFQAFLDELGPNRLSEAQARVVEAVDARKAQLVRHALGDLQQWQTQLRALANQLEDGECPSSAATVDAVKTQHVGLSSVDRPVVPQAGGSTAYRARLLISDGCAGSDWVRVIAELRQDRTRRGAAADRYSATHG